MMKIIIVVGFMATITCVLGYAKETREQLTEKVELLETRVKALEKVLLDNSSNGKQLAPEKQQWRKLRKGMKPGEVRELLGEPERIEAGFQTRWYYFSDETGGYVIFDRENEVYGWDEPQ
jgi:outer membrane protein assembly factor BamE (lipoprotein component of BamABCDE complex)